MTKVVQERYHWVRINSKNEKNFSKRFYMQVCELLQVLTETDIKGALKNKCSWNSKTIKNLKST